MITLTKEQLADLLRESYQLGAQWVVDMKNDRSLLYQFNAHEMRERAIQPLVHRSSCGHDDHGREVE